MGQRNLSSLKSQPCSNIKTEISQKKIITITTIFDNYLAFKNSHLRTGWGFGCLIKTKKNNILFDTGADGQTLLDNLKEIKINPKNIDIIVLSHIHGDHVGGLSGFLDKNSDVTVYLPASFPISFKNEIVSAGAEIIEIDKTLEIVKNIYSTGELGTFIKEQSLIINTERGLIIITGCAHPGIVNIIKKAKKLTGKDVYFVIGGFHLSGSSDSELREIINSFKKLNVKKVAPCHCSGDRCKELFREEYKNNFIANGVGKIIEI